MKCPACNEGSLEKRKDKFVLEIPKGPSLVIPNIDMRVCSKCEDIVVDAINTRLIDKIALASVVLHYRPMDKKMPASVGDWIRKVVGLPVSEISQIAGQNEATYYQATRRGSMLDSMVKYFLILKAAQFIVGVDFSQFIVETLKQVDEAVSKDKKKVDFIEQEATA